MESRRTERKTWKISISWRFRAAGIIALWFVIRAVASAAGFTSADAETLFAAHAKAFYREQDGRAWFAESTDGGKVSYWMRAEQMEMVLDAHERTPSPQKLAMFTNLFHGFLVDHGTNWSKNPYNDDIMWMVIACTRAALLTGMRSSATWLGLILICAMREPTRRIWAAAYGGKQTTARRTPASMDRAPSRRSCWAVPLAKPLTLPRPPTCFFGNAPSCSSPA
jgi:hypothetical protein